MAESLYRRNAISTFSKVITNRTGMMRDKQHIAGKSIQSRNPAFIRLTGKCNACKGGGGTRVLPLDVDTINEEYRPSMKPKPILQRVQISFGGDWGLARKITANIKCFDRDSFEDVQKHFLLPGNYINATFGYSISPSEQWNPNDGEHTLTGFRVATFAFSAGDDGSWVGTFTAVSSAEAIKSIDMCGGINVTGNIIYKVAGKVDSESPMKVASISELIASDAQRNGSQKMDEINKNNSGYLIGEFQDYKKTDNSEVVAAMVIYTNDHLVDKSGDRRGGVSRWIQRQLGTWDEAEDSVHEIYVTLGYVVDRIVNGQIKMSIDAAMKSSLPEKDYSKIKIKFSTRYSKSKLPPNIESGDPTSVLILGRLVATFHEREQGTMMDFNSIKGLNAAGPLSVNDVKAWDGSILRLDKILLHRDVISKALSTATTEKVNESESVDPKDVKDTVISLNDFFKEIFDCIRECTGGALALRLVIDPEDEEGLTYLVVDQNYAGDKDIECYLFNPIDGDGNTRSCNITSNGGGNEYRTSMFLANSKKGDVASNLRGCDDDLEKIRNSKLIATKERYWEIIDDPGKMMKDKFNGKQISALKSVMSDLYRYAPQEHTNIENINWPGMTIDLTINGAYGIIPGCAIATTQMPSSWYTDKKIYFMVREVTHDFADSDWITNIQGIMSMYPHLSIVGGGGGGPNELAPPPEIKA